MTKIDCKHGQLARSCEVCELEAGLAEQVKVSADLVERLRMKETERRLCSERAAAAEARVVQLEAALREFANRPIGAHFADVRDIARAALSLPEPEPDGSCANPDCPIGCPESHCLPMYSGEDG